MNRSLTAIAALLLATALPSDAQQRVYQWKDAKGVTHYTDMPPPQAHKARDIDNRGSATAVSAVKQDENPQCLDARANLLRLQGSQTVGVDTNGDGKADRNLSPEERSAQTDLNQAAVKAYCPSSKP
ncbi:DUF4124 domain-containing protein [Thermomonas sp.]|jgi:hypothetical protein|uniref:DUF4124 domain-containing protein n=1 Tax=Thermomonas sp. TaxID=1971895 RepID=UPI001B477C97|nr:DUF4124 domain-containing protein [Thermomonas sp.]MBK6333657.1 DUF4124 domain-containing protein [Thermomonas sp.]MBK6415881.1 DUF4124 domain-containing protein [Thermomonas sp.]MBK6925444.1 DUF4124 domain-containing protein [Thermomonas sp.]MBK7205200.1 DUF4124 domain-containing protein [Thermomonas sp.]MBK9669607.1 DUF4124 domain-containing protein [Thermomonas sp.]